MCKKVMAAAAALFVFTTGWGQASSKISVISGRMTSVSPTVKNLYLYSTAEGARESYASVAINAEGDYAFALNNPKEGLYYLSTAAEPERGRSYSRLYIKPGDNIEVNLSAKGDTAFVTGGSREEQMLNKWQQASDKVYRLALYPLGDTGTYATFFPAFEKLLPVAEQMKKEMVATDKKFGSYMAKLIDVDLQLSALSLIYSLRTKHPVKSQYPAYYAQTFHPGMYCDAALTENGDGVKLIGLYVMHMFMEKDSAARVADKDRLYAPICNDTLKALYVAEGLSKFKTPDGIEQAIEPFKPFFAEGRLKEKYNRALKGVSTFKAGTAAHEFNYPDAAGKFYSLKKDLAGKVVYLDMWATWCGPCKAELPHLAKIEEEFKNENVAFVSISVDEVKDKNKWLDFVKKEQLGGIQLFAGGFQSDIASFYGIKAIPRFMLFDTKGNIISIDAPRPSNAELKLLLRKTLAVK